MKNQKGQVLLIVVMLLATAITVVLSISFTTTTDTQITKLEEESQRALAAAEAGIEAALKQDVASIAIEGLAGLDDSGITGNAVTTNIIGSTFVTPLLQKDDQYTFYLSNYNNGVIGGNSYNSGLNIHYGSVSESCNDLAIEITLIYGNDPDYEIKRLVGDTGGKLGGEDSGATATSATVEGQSFKCSLPINVGLYSDAKILIVRTLFSQTRVGFYSGNKDVPLKPQGNFITSTATVTSGVTKKVQLFQSYPQIPSEFFVTRF